jgi:hypothetical protein
VKSVIVQVKVPEPGTSCEGVKRTCARTGKRREGENSRRRKDKMVLTRMDEDDLEKFCEPEFVR